MKKLLSLVLTLALLTAAFPALAAPCDIAFLDTAKDWVKRVNPENADYVAELTVLNTEVVRSTLRAGNSITELKVETPSFFFGRNSEPEYSELALAQYSEDGLALRVGDQTWVIDVQTIYDLLTHRYDYTKDAVEADIALARKLAIRFVTEVLNPTISLNPAGGSINLHFDVNQDEFAERMPAFLNGLTDQEEAIDTLLAKYGVTYAIAHTEYEPTLAGIRATWSDYMEKTGNQVPEFSLLADAAIAPAKGDHPPQAGITGVFTQGENASIFSLEYLPTKENGFIAEVLLSGISAGQVYDYRLDVTADAASVNVDLSTVDQETMLYSLSMTRENGAFDAMAYAYSVTTGQLNELEYKQTYDESTGYLSASLNHITGTLADQNSRSIFSLSASIQEKGATGVVYFGEDSSHHFIWTKAPLYDRLMLTAYTGDAVRQQADLWLFPQGSDNYRYRASIRTFGKSFLKDHYLVTGTINPSSFALNVAEVGGDTLLDLNLEREKEENQITYTGDCSFLRGETRIDASAVLTLEEKLPISLEADATISAREGDNRLNAYRLSWIPGEITYMDGINYYTMTRTVNTADELTYVIVRNHAAELGAITASLNEDDEISLKVNWTDFVDFAVSAKPVAEEAAEEVPAEVEEAPVILGVFDGTVDADGIMHGILTQLAEEAIEEEPAVEPVKIEPLDVSNATIIDVKYFIRNYMNFVLY